MRAYIDTRGDRKNPPQFEAPGNIVFVTLDSGVTEAFINGTQPAGMTPGSRVCDPAFRRHPGAGGGSRAVEGEADWGA